MLKAGRLLFPRQRLLFPRRLAVYGKPLTTLTSQQRFYDASPRRGGGGGERFRGGGGGDRFKDEFRPPRQSGNSRSDDRDYNYVPSDRRRDSQASPSLKTNFFEQSRSYGRSNSGSSQGRGDGRSDVPRRGNKFNAGRQLKPIHWDTENLMPFTKNFYKEQPAVANRSVEEIKKLLKEQQISIEGKAPIPKPISNFAEAGLPDHIQKVLTANNLKEPTAIQKIGFPVALSGRDLIGVSRTGSGKTLAFVVPALIHIAAQPPLRPRDGPVALILAPTRELACQIHEEAGRFSRSRQIRCTAVYGGAPRYHQESQLVRGTEVIIACPGRLLDFLESEVTSLKRVTYLVLDEADRMLDMGFEPQIRSIVSQIRPDRQTLMYSATWPQSVNALARDFCREAPVCVKVPRYAIMFCQLFSGRSEKDRKFSEWITKMFSSSDGRPPKILVFCGTRSFCDRLTRDLVGRGKGAVAIHGQKTQRDRDRAIGEFKSGARQILVATDVAARGLDISDVTAVVNYDLPKTIEDYVHRIGRTGRAGKKGTAVTFFS
ncbi:uncharacterized protein LOC129617513 [Condylostylus longicornis]|uniref:uncharacterized protein LOC129617513 n=1 Tax=Condylostylus longicornis TaxID=2530218 RepID=UPI00244DE221|nr:uncharacterized protein LOC129617513 [Condylostylus longicornis]